MKNRNIIIAVVVVIVLFCICCLALTLFAVTSGALTAWFNIASVSTSSSSGPIASYTSSSLSSSVSTVSERTYTNSDYNLELTYPTDWTAEDNVSGITAQFVAPLSNSRDTFHENLNFSVTSVTNFPDYDTYVDQLVNSEPGDLGTFELQSNTTTTFMGVEARSVTYTMQSDGIDLQGSQLYFTKNNLLFVFTYTGQLDEYDTYLQDANDIMASLQF